MSFRLPPWSLFSTEGVPGPGDGGRLRSSTAASDDDSGDPSLRAAVAITTTPAQALSQWHRLCPPSACPLANPRSQTLHLWSSQLACPIGAFADVPQLSVVALGVMAEMLTGFLPFPAPGRAPESIRRLVATSRSCMVNCPAAAPWREFGDDGGVIPRHGRSGWQRMCPKSAFGDGKSLPHSVHGGVSLLDENRGLGLAPPSGLGLFRRGFGEISAGGGNASVSVSVVSWGCGGEGGGAAAGGGSMEIAAGVVGREMEMEKLPRVVFVSGLNPPPQARSVTWWHVSIGTTSDGLNPDSRKSKPGLAIPK